MKSYKSMMDAQLDGSWSQTVIQDTDFILEECFYKQEGNSIEKKRRWIPFKIFSLNAETGFLTCRKIGGDYEYGDKDVFVRGSQLAQAHFSPRGQVLAEASKMLSDIIEMEKKDEA